MRSNRDAKRRRGGDEEVVPCSMVDVACGTLMRAGQRHLGSLLYTFISVDEVTQATEPGAVAGLCNAHPGGRVVLVGGHIQFHPTVKDPNAACAGLGTSLFQMLTETIGIARCMCQTQHRMHSTPTWAGWRMTHSRPPVGGRHRGSGYSTRTLHLHQQPAPPMSRGYVGFGYATRVAWSTATIP